MGMILKVVLVQILFVFPSSALELKTARSRKLTLKAHADDPDEPNDDCFFNGDCIKKEWEHTTKKPYTGPAWITQYVPDWNNRFPSDKYQNEDDYLNAYDESENDRQFVDGHAKNGRKVAQRSWVTDYEKGIIKHQEDVARREGVPGWR
eukprot:gnl/MRDRNA2_/MRDRNA2_34492_c0_seq1.p1 gnl/MRDRNA2_/MRDRNA2_34492_c0~~gnl/MRDRNA2_/MRDRNA2_34492_c0_seq1.p1  ORF type:complete len:149 (+),score=24.67 gnl/MRDRNA2_/MRDRNA2_34492_c0_seq1:139-585(+)